MIFQFRIMLEAWLVKRNKSFDRKIKGWIMLSFLPCPHIYGTKEILKITGNLGEYFQKVPGFDRLLITFN